LLTIIEGTFLCSLKHTVAGIEAKHHKLFDKVVIHRERAIGEELGLRLMVVDYTAMCRSNSPLLVSRLSLSDSCNSSNVPALEDQIHPDLLTAWVTHHSTQ
jgi:hypothetical protein